ncbi:Nonribosomal peptide synthetase 1 [Fusarium oxysporum f. sp. albedinis]|nr:Nonribosomal peptide synthetase 1 [Fusarium oxysporum f. sp. albedinis]
MAYEHIDWCLSEVVDPKYIAATLESLWPQHHTCGGAFKLPQRIPLTIRRHPRGFKWRWYCKVKTSDENLHRQHVSECWNPSQTSEYSIDGECSNHFQTFTARSLGLGYSKI